MRNKLKWKKQKEDWKNIFPNIYRADFIFQKQSTGMEWKLLATALLESGEIACN